MAPMAHHDPSEASAARGSTTMTPRPRGAFDLGAFAIDELRPMRVVVIGAGCSGILAGVRVPQRLRNVELAIYEKMAGVGGTWSVSFLTLDDYGSLKHRVVIYVREQVSSKA